MAKKIKSIPVNIMADESGAGIAFERIFINDSDIAEKEIFDFEDAKQFHRHDRHSFFLLEKGTVFIEIDFQKYKIKAPSVIYIHPNQVHRTLTLKNATVSSWAINNEKLDSEYLKLLEEITPVKPLALQNETFLIIAETVSQCMKFAEHKNYKLYQSLLKNGCNTLVALTISHYLQQAATAGKMSRFETITKAFHKTLQQNFITVKRPADYAQKLNISTPYLNECVKSTTGYSVSYHIQQRIILEAKRLLYYSDNSVKEIASQLGYDDYPYFTRLFAKIAGMSALAFRNKNRD